MDRGKMLRVLREKYWVKSFDALAGDAEIDPKTIRDRWEHGKEADFKAFWKYIKVLKLSAIALGKIAEFESDLERVVEHFFPDVYEEYGKARKAGDSRTREEWAQDLVDFSRSKEISRPFRLAKVDTLVNGLPRPDYGSRHVLPIQDIETSESWQTLPNKAFEISLVFPIETYTVSLHRRNPAVYRTPYLLSIDLRGQKYGIFSESGKKLLRRVFVNDGRRSVLSKSSATIQEFLMRLNSESADLSWRVLMDGDLVPLRWASAGILPIAHCLRQAPGGDWKDDGDWVVLFLRDIPPVGLNVGNGASEIAKERLEELISREFAEELILLKHRPIRNERVEQLVFYDKNGGRALNNTQMFRQFLGQHQRLRELHDKIDIEVGDERRFLTALPTPFAVRVFDDDASAPGSPGAQSGPITRCQNVIFSVNPGELGIEVIRPYSFNLHEGEWLMDGEILPSSRAGHPYLVRRPVVMIRLDFLREQFHKTGGLGEVVEGPTFLGGKKLPEIPAGAFRVFADLDARKVRLKEIVNSLKNARTDEETLALESESRLIKDWLKEYGVIFEEAHSGTKPLKADAVTTFCPVTFKTLELAFAHHVPGF